MFYLTAIASPGSSPAPLSCFPHAVAVRISLSHPGPPAVVASSSVADPSDLGPLHSELLSLISSWPAPLAQYPPSFSVAAYLIVALFLAPSSARLFCRRLPPCSRCPRLHPRLSARQPCSIPVPPPFSGAPPPPLPSLGLLRPLAPPRGAPSPGLTINISRKDKYVSNQTGGVVAHWSVAGGSAPRGKIPSRPLSVVGDGMSRPRFLHRPQQ